MVCCVSAIVPNLHRRLLMLAACSDLTAQALEYTQSQLSMAGTCNVVVQVDMLQALHFDRM
jgi:hypothetical protein